MKFKRHKEILKWLMVDMPYNKPFKIKDEQRAIIIDIFELSELNMPTEPHKAYKYYFKIENNHTLITKIRYYE